MLNHYYDPYPSIPEINKALYYNYQPHQIQHQQQQPHHNHQSGNKWVQTWNGQELSRDSSNDSYYSNNPNAISAKIKSLTPSPRKMLTSSFAENSLVQKKVKNRSPQRIYKTHSDLNKEKKKTSKSILKDDDLKKDRDIIIPVDISTKKGEYEHNKVETTDPLNQILKKVSNIETNFLVTNHKILMMENRLESCVANQKAILSKLDTVEKEFKNSGALNPELLKEIKDALNIDFDIDLEIKPDEKISKYSINSIKAYKAQGNSE